ncbi:MAG TPA: AAA family ATPase [Ilumatobacter sp.]|nr:AAA family ATPase [Ilumatobacter sp.]
MLELPRHHVARPALVDALRAAAVVVIEAPSGFGKSTLATELARPQHTIDLALTGSESGRHTLLLPLRRALRRAGEHGAAAALGEMAVDSADALDSMLDALHDADPLTLIVDDAHHLGDEAHLLVRLVERRPPGARLIIGARVLPPRAIQLRTDPRVTYVDAHSLRFGEADVASLLRNGFGVSVDDRTVARLARTTEGWPAALTFVGTRMQRSALVDVDAAAAPGELSSVVLAALPPSLREVAIQLAHLAWLDHELADAASGHPEALRELVDAGLPFAVDTDGRYRLPGAFAEALARRAPLTATVARRAAAWHLAERPFEALAVLRQAGEWDALAELLTALPPAARARLTSDEITSTIDAVPTHVVRQYPSLMIELARALARAGLRDRHHEVLARAERLAPTQSGAYRRAVEVQRVADMLYTGDRAEVARRIDDVLDAAGDHEDGTVARALVVSGVLHAWASRRPEASRALRRAAELFVELGEPFEASRALGQLGYGVDLHDDLRAAEDTFDRAVELSSDDARARAAALTYRGEARVWLGRRDDGAHDLRTALDLGRAARDSRAQAYALWGLAVHASLEADAPRAVAYAEAADRQLAGWADTLVGVTFAAAMADVLDRAGALPESAAMLARARARRDELPDVVRLAEFAVLARHGDPALVEQMWPDVEADPGIEPFERLRCRALRAYAALRRGAPTVERLYAELRAHADALGLPDVPANLEPVAVAALEHWSTGATGWEIRCIGPLSVTYADTEVPLPPGRPAALLGLLAATGEPMRVPWVIDVLWPDASEAAGRSRLRQVLYRLRRAGVELVVRVGDDQLALHGDVRTDVEQFDHQAAAAAGRDADAVAGARRATELVRGPLLDGVDLPGEPPEIEAIRERIRVRHLGLLDRLVEAAAATDDERGAIEWAAQAHRADPSDEVGALRLVRLLVADGRDPDARAVAAATVHALSQLDLDPTPALRAAASS